MSRESREAGFDVADIDVGILNDAKMKKLVRACDGDEALIARSAIAYVAAVLGSWADGERIPLEDAAPIWLTGVDELTDRLVRADLVDHDGRVVEHAFASWFGPASDRREASRERWRRNKRARPKPSDGGGEEPKPGAPPTAPTGSPPRTPRGTSEESARVPRPTVPLRTVPFRPLGPSSSRAPARGRGSLEPVGSLLPHLIRTTPTGGNA